MENIPNYSVAKNYRSWAVLKDGEMVEGHKYHPRKRDALAAIPQIQARAEYEARVLAEDLDGISWTPEEEQNINEYAEVLRENPEKFTFVGRRRIVDIARTDHDSDARTIEQHLMQPGPQNNWSKLVCAEVRRRRAARVEAFKRAGLDLDRYRCDMHVKRRGKDFESTFSYSSVADAYEERDEIIARGAQHGEVDYEFRFSERVV
jgi:hypothetical protein